MGLKYKIIILGIFIIIFTFLPKFRLIKKESYIDSTKKDVEIVSLKDQNDFKIKKIKEVFARIKISKINLNQELVNIDSPLNYVDYNIQILKNSNMPNIKNGNLILAAHSGNSDVSYFRNLKYLSYNDEAIIEYQQIAYIYKLVNVYEILKTGYVSIIRDSNINTLTLITCIEDTNRQKIFIFELIKTKKL